MKDYYFDWAATSPTSKEVIKTMEETALNFFGNPSSSHRPGKEACGKLYDLRERCASMLGCSDSQLLFTSGGSESNSMVLSSLFWKLGRGSVMIPGTEHPSVAEFSGFLKELGFSVLNIDAPFGFIDPDMLASKLQQDTVMVCLHAVHNVSGALQPLKELVNVVRSHEKQTGRKIHIHADAVQALGKIPFSIASLDIDSASFSAHKLTGPRGVGCLYTRTSIQPLSRGGSQEFGQRAGTENLPGIAGMVRAMELLVPPVEEHLTHVRRLRNTLYDSIGDTEALSFMQDLNRLDQYSPYILLLTVEPIPSEVMIRVLNDKGFYISAGSACSSKISRKRKGVLTSMGFSSKIASGALRISFGHATCEEDVVLLADILTREAGTLRELLR